MITGVSELSDLKSKKLIERQNIDGIDVIIVNVYYANYMKYLRRLLVFFVFIFFATLVGLRVKKPDIILASSTPLTIGVPGYIISRLKKVPFLFEVRDLWPEAPIQLRALTNPILIKMARWLEKFLYKKAIKIIALSPDMKEEIIRTGVEKRKVEVIPNCSDLDLYHPDVQGIHFRERFFLVNKFVVSYFGAMGEANGLDLVVKVALKLKEKDDNSIVFVLAGDGSQKENLKSFCQEHNLDNVIFIGSIPRVEIPKLVAASDLCLVIFKNVPVLHTNSPNKLFDALAGGKPVLVNTAGWTKVLLEKHDAGVYVEPDNPEAMADMLLRLKNDPKWCTIMGQNAYKLAQEKFDRKKLAQRLEKVLSEALGCVKTSIEGSIKAEDF